MEGKNSIIEGLDVIDLVRLISKKNKSYQAILLSELETKLNEDDFIIVRKHILDWFNNYTRAIVRAVFGSSFEDYVK